MYCLISINYNNIRENSYLISSYYAISSKISIETDNSIDDESKIKAFSIDNMKIIVDDDNIMSIIGETVVKVSKEEFLRSPVKCIKKLLGR